MPQSTTVADRTKVDRYRRDNACHELTSHQKQLIFDHLELASMQAKRHRRKGVDPADLQQVAYVGLVSAARRYEPEKGDFPAFASVTISGELKKYFRDRAWSVRPPRRIQELKPVVTADVQEDRFSASGITALAQRHSVTNDDITAVLTSSSCYCADSLDAPPPHSDAPRGDMIDNGTDDYARADEVMDLQRSLATLHETDRHLICMRFIDELTQEQIAERLGTSQMQISRRLRRLMTRLRTTLEAHESELSHAS